jgi:hypothetical protein
MPTEKIPIWLGSNKNVDEYGLGGLSAELRDAFIDELRNVRKRPGVETLIDLGTNSRIDGLYWWGTQDCLIAVSDTDVYQIKHVSGDEYDSDVYPYAVSGQALASGANVSFVDYGTHLYAANGGKIFKIPASPASPIAALSATAAPTQVSFLTTMDTYLIANNLASGAGEQIWWSEVLEPDTWQGEFATAEASVDSLRKITAVNGLLYLLGDKTLEIWANDGVTPFVPLAQGTLQIGTCAPDSFLWCRDGFYWLDESRQLVTLIGNKIQRLPAENTQSLASYLQSLTTVSDARAQYMAIAGREFYILQLPTEDVTIVYDINTSTWSFWSVYDAVNEQYSRWFGEQLVYSDSWSTRLLGHISNGNIYKLSTSYIYDGVENLNDRYVLDQSGEILLGVGGNPITIAQEVGIAQAGPIRTLIRTGQIDHDTQTVNKHSAKYTLLCKRTGAFTTGISSIAINMRWRDNGTTEWSAWKAGSIDAVDNSTFRVAWRRNGQYYTRQLEIVHADEAPILIVHLEETFDYGV